MWSCHHGRLNGHFIHVDLERRLPFFFEQLTILFEGCDIACTTNSLKDVKMLLKPIRSSSNLIF